MDFLTVNYGGSGIKVEVLGKLELCIGSNGKRSDAAVY